MFNDNFFKEMRRLNKEMDELFANAFGFEKRMPQLLSSSSEKIKSLAKYKEPSMDLWDDEKYVYATFDLPGVKKDEIDVSLHNGFLEVKVEKKSEEKEENKKKGFYHYERSYSGFYRGFHLPCKVDESKVNAKYNNGVLEVTIPKLDIETKKKKFIEVE